MPIHLIFLFLFQSGLAFAFSYFIARVLLNGSQPENLDTFLRGLRFVRNLVMAICLVLPPVVFLAYFKSLPEDKSASVALWPAAWVFVILAAVVAALSIAPLRPKQASRY